jgi:mannan endo-1,4-beta-mannosidase
VPRPAYNTGTGFYIVGTKLYDPTGHEFRPRGLNRVHWNQSGDDVGIPATGANTERFIMDFTRKPSDNVALMQKQMINMGLVPMPGNWAGTCKVDTASIRAIVDTWVAQAPDMTTIDRYSIINIANEWGPSASTVWRDEYISAIARMRAAGYKGTLSITSGGCGQDQTNLIKYAQQVFDSDPEKNILFDLHIYGHFYATQTATWQTLFSTAMQQIAALNLPIMLGEFGPGKNLAPSPTLLTPEQIVSTAESYGFGWLAWAYDANDGYNCTASENSYAIVKKCGIYKTDADLTGYGLQVVPMLKSMATHAQVVQ